MRLFICFIIFLGVGLGLISGVSAHTADEAYTDIYLSGTDENRIHIELFFTWVETQFIIGDLLDPSLAASEQTLPEEIIQLYIMKHFSVQNNNEFCDPIFHPIPKRSDSELVFGRGIQIPITFTCLEPLQNINITNTLFIENYPLQQHFTTIYDNQQQEILFKTLSKDESTLTFSVASYKQIKNEKNAEREQKLPVLPILALLHPYSFQTFVDRLQSFSF